MAPASFTRPDVSRTPPPHYTSPLTWPAGCYDTHVQMSQPSSFCGAPEANGVAGHSHRATYPAGNPRRVSRAMTNAHTVPRLVSNARDLARERCGMPRPGPGSAGIPLRRIRRPVELSGTGRDHPE